MLIFLIECVSQLQFNEDEGRGERSGAELIRTVEIMVVSLFTWGQVFLVCCAALCLIKILILSWRALFFLIRIPEFVVLCPMLIISKKTCLYCLLHCLALHSLNRYTLTADTEPKTNVIILHYYAIITRPVMIYQVNIYLLIIFLEGKFSLGC